MSAIAQASTATRAARSRALRHSPLALAMAVALGAAPGIAAAQVASTQLPTGGSIAGGTGTINAASGATLTIDQTSSRMALNWSAFDIGSSATVTFNQPSTNSAVLNLVQSGNPTQIFGNLNANGQVFLINPNGIIFGSTAQFNVGGLVASTLGTTASAFMSGNDTLDAGGNTVALMSNSGTINAAAGAVDLIGGKVVNSGTITASAGNINLVGADKVTLTFESGGFGVVVDKALQLQLDSVAVDNSNSGTLSAPGGIITLQARAAQGLFDQLINNSGTITAAALSGGSDGSVSLVANGSSQTSVGGSGSIDVGSGAINISTDHSVQQSGTYTAGTLGGSIGGDASFSGSNHIAALASLSVDGNLSLTNAIDLAQSGALTVGGSSSFSLGSHALTLDNAGNDFGQAVGLSAGNTTIVDSGALTLGTLATGNLAATSTGALNLGSGSVTGTLAATSNGGAIGQSASSPLTVTGTSTLNAGSGAITLQQSGNDFGGAVSLTGSGIALTDANALTIGTLSLGNNSALSLNAGGTLTLPSSAIATGSANLSLHSGNVLATAAALSGTNVSLSGDNGITLAHDITATGTLALTTVNSAIAQSAGAIAASGTSSVNAGSGAITLTGAGNHFGQAVSLTGGTTQITDSGALTLGTLATGNLTAISTGALNLGRGTVTGTLAATSNGGAITQSASNPLTVTGTSTLNAGTGAITLTTSGNDFGQAVSLTGGSTAITDANALTLGTLATGKLTAISTGALNLGRGTVTGTLAATSNNGAITQSASNPLTVTGTSALNAGTGAITLTTTGNDFGQAVSLTGGSTALTDANALTLSTLATGNLTLISNGVLNLGTGTVTGTLDATSNGSNIRQSGLYPITVSGISNFNAGSTGNVSLTTNGNDFGQAVSLTGRSVAIVDIGALTLDTLATGDLFAVATGDVNLGHGTVTGGLTVYSNGGAITQSASNPLTVTATSYFNAGTGAITLTTAGNDFRQALTLISGNAAITNANALAFDALTTGSLTAISSGALNLGRGTVSGALSATSNGGAISQSTTNPLTVSGTSTLDAGAGSITLEQAGNDFGGAVSLTGSGIRLVDGNDLNVAALTLGSNSALSLIAAGTLTLPANAIDTGSADLTLQSGNALTTGAALSGTNVNLRGDNGITLAHNVTAAGALTLSAVNSAIGQSAGVLTVNSSSSIDAGTGAIALTSAGNDFGQAVSLTGGSTAISDANALTFGTLATANLTAISSGALNLGSGTVNGTLSATSNGGAITQSASNPLTVTGTSTLNAGTGAITLTTSGNDFGQAVSLTGGTTSITDSGALTLGTLATGALTATSSGALNLGSGTVTGALSATSNGGAITQSTTSPLTVSGTSSLNAGTGAITLEQAGNDFGGAVSLTGSGIRLVDSNDLNVAALTLGSNSALSLIAAGTLSLPANAIDTGSADLTLHSGNVLATAAALSGTNVSLGGGDGITLAHDVTAGTLALTTSNSAIVQSAGALAVSGTSSIDAGTGAIVLTGAGNDFGQAVSLTGGTTAITDSGALTLGTLATGNLTATSSGALNLGSGTVNGALVATSNGGAIGQSTTNPLAVSGTSTLDAGSGSIALTNVGNDFGQAVSATGRGIALADANALTIGALTLGSNSALSLIAGGALSLPAIAIDTGTADLTLHSGGVLTTAAALSGNRLDLDGAAGIVLAHDVTAGATLRLQTSNAAISQTGGALVVAGTSTLDAGTGAIALNQAGNDFGQAVSVTGSGVALTDANDLSIGALSLGSNSALSLTAGGTLSLPATAIDTGSADITLRSGGVLTTAAALSGNRLDLDSASGIVLADNVTARDTLRLKTTNAGISQSASSAVTVAGTSSIDAGSGAIALTNAGNDFVGAVDLSGSGIQLADRNDLSIAAVHNGNNAALSLLADGSLDLPGGAIDTGSGDLSLVARHGTLSLGGALSGHNLTLSGGSGLSLADDVAVTGTLLLSTDNAAIVQTAGALTVDGSTSMNTGSGGIALTGSGNHFAGTVDIAGGAVQLHDSGALRLGTLSVDSLAVSSGGALNLGSGSVRGALQADSGNAAIGQSGALDIGGATRLTAGSGAITLDQANRFAGPLAFDGGAVRIGALGALTLGASNAAALQLTSTGALSQNGALRVTGDTAIATGSGAIALDDAGNDFQGLLALSGGAARVRDANALSLGTLSLGALDVGSHGALNLGEGSIAGALVADSGGSAVSQRGALQVGGSTTIDSGAGAIALDTVGNDFQGEVNLSGGATTLRDRNALALGSVAVAALNVTSGGALSLGQGSIGGDLIARSDAGGGAASSIVTASATPAASGAGIGQRGALTVAGTTTLDAGIGTIALTDAGNDFQGTLQASGGDIAIADRNDLTVAAQAGGSLTLSAAGALRTAGALSGSSIGLSAGGDLGLGHDVSSSGSLQLRSGGAIAQTAGTLGAASLSGSSSGATSLTGDNAIAALGAFSATQLSLRTLGDLSVTGPVAVAGTLRLDAGGDLAIDGALSGQSVWLQAGGDLSEAGSGRISADTLSGSVGGSTRLGAAGAAIDNRIGTLGDFASPGGFSLTNGQSLTLSALNGSAYTVNAGTSALYLAVLGDLLQTDTAWLYDGAGTFSASGRIGTVANPIYVLGVSNQTVAAVGLPPAYFYAVAADGSLLTVDGESGFNVPTSAFASRAQSSNSRTIAYVDLSAANASYRAFGLVKPGLRLPADQQPACDADDPDAQCTQE